MSEKLVFEKNLQATPAEVYRAFTNAMLLRAWLCDNSYVEAREGGNYFLAWNGGYHAVGNFAALEPGKHIRMSWRGSSDPGPMQVDVTLAEESEGTHLTLTHGGMGTGAEWEHTIHEIREGWQDGLDSLKSVLEDGLDLRVMRRPMLGIFPAPLNTDTAAQLGVPVTQGTHILGVADGMGAAAAGLQTDDVLIRLDGKPVVDFPSMQAALAGHHGGDVVKIEFYRGQELHTADMQLSKRSAPDVPETPAALADSVRETYAQLADELAAELEGVPEAVLAQKPAEQEWSVCENLAHLIWTERWVHIWMHGAAGGDNQVPWPDNGPIHLAGTLAAYPTSAELIAELDRSKAATVGMIEALSASFVAHHKFAYQQLAQLVTGNFAHDRQHHAQIHDAIEAVKASV